MLHTPSQQPRSTLWLQVLADIRRLLPKVDPVRQLLANPGLVLDMDSAGQASSIEKEGELMDEAMLSAQ
jgi:hypothetical protein